MFLPSNGSDAPIPVGVVRGVAYDIREADDVCLSILGYSREDFARGGVNWREITPPEYLHLDDAAFRQLMGVGGFTTPWQKEYIRKDGSRVPVLLVGAREPQSADRWIGFVIDLSSSPATRTADAVKLAAHDDTTLSFRLVGELVRERQRMVAMLDSTQELIWSTDREFRLIGFNRAYQERLHELSGRKFAIGDALMDEAFLPEQRSLWSRWYARAVAGERFSVRAEETHDGISTVNEYRIAPISLPDEGIVGASVVGSDITARHVAESALRISEARFRTLTNASPLGIFITDLDGACVYANPKLAEIFGTRVGELMGSGYTERMHPDDRDAVLTECGIAMQAGLGFDAEFRVVRPDGVERHVRIWTSPIHNSGVLEGFAGTVEDDTEKRALAERLRQRERMESLGTLAGGVAHDFNNMLGIVLGHTELALAELGHSGAKGAELGEHLREIQTASSRARDLVQQILSFSRRVERDITPVDLGQLVTESVRLLRSAFPVSVDMVWQVPPTPVMVLGDATALQQVIVNLCTNAEHAMRAKGGGTLTLRLETEGAGETGVARLTVADTGTGMSAAVRARAFEPFFTTKAVGEGTGMGLAVVHGLVESYGGGLSLESTEHEGTTVRVALPLTSQSTSANAPKVAEAGGVGDVLLVEDESALARFAERALQRAGYTVTICEDGHAALARFLEPPQRFDVVLTDLTMPGMSGDQLAAELKRNRPELPIILMSGYSATLTSRNMHEFGVDLLLQKPFKATELLNGVAAVLRSVTARSATESR